MAASRRHERGYTLAALIVAVTVLNVALAAALPVWSTAARRDREEELIARGLQYAEAIRVFKARFGRPPMRLEELLEAEPRSIRRLWTDPMTEGGEWAVVLTLKRTKDPSKKGHNVTVGAISGVRSRSLEPSMRILFGAQNYNLWSFTDDLFAPPFGTAGSPPVALVPARWIGRPFYPGLIPDPGAR